MEAIFRLLGVVLNLDTKFLLQLLSGLLRHVANSEFVLLVCWVKVFVESNAVVNPEKLCI